MSLSWYLARFMAVVIVMISASFGASVVQAHDGHAHHPSVPAASVSTVPFQDLAPPVAQFVGVAVEATSTRVVSRLDPAPPLAVRALAIAAASADNGKGKGDCNGVCCSMGMVCCHSVLTPAGLVAVPALRLCSRMRTPQQADRPSLAPEALPKPPRPFA